MKRIKKRWILLALVIAAAVGWYFYSRANAPAPGSQYKTAEVTRGDLSEVITANGILNPVRVVSVGTQVSGTVAKLYVDFNDKVKEGQLLLELDPSVYAARLAASEAALANVRATAALQSANARRSAQLFKQQYISRQEYETALASAQSSAAQVQAAQAQIKQDRTNLGYTVIRSPVSGAVIARSVDLGQTVAASFSTPELFRIARDLTQMQIEAAVAEADVSKVRVGQKVNFTVDAYGTRNFEGFVRQIRLNPTSQQNVVTYTVIVGVANPDGALLPGMTANASFLISNFENAVLLPNAALSWKPADYTPPRRTGAGQKRVPNDPSMLTVFVLRDAAPVPVRIKIGASDQDNTQVVSGALKAGDKVIVGDTSKDKKGGGFGPPGTGGNSGGGGRGSSR
ncbi:efflux RND transporter periplasmic adaptor subunit [Glacieibacterium frigidum]|uniref:Efflux RND transporter periplasmic adaptor subunit n=1 Tax=Glacieibacterium frigidum TaxID=2593303 RepID=A0A552UFT8_9SPHN|nr:efflux RND transporter periplasmic adaptor subunit [Glacieibacterium frigidum]TRW17074.1 efflux RND transporter periplasmic adaptor subunit [Glacieibacterium frigidum]